MKAGGILVSDLYNYANPGKNDLIVKGNVGIGTPTPYSTSRLHVKSQAATHWSLLVEASGSDQIIGLSHDGTSGVVSTSYLVNGGWSPLQFRTQNTTRMFLSVDGNVGIGTTTPDAKLSVKGQIHAQEVKVDLNGAIAPDYVFDEDYKLPSLEEIQSYITEHKHLPEVPSAKEMEANGINLGEMNLILLKKVEELTLLLMVESAHRQSLAKEVAALKMKVESK